MRTFRKGELISSFIIPGEGFKGSRFSSAVAIEKRDTLLLKSVDTSRPGRRIRLATVDASRGAKEVSETVALDLGSLETSLR